MIKQIFNKFSIITIFVILISQKSIANSYVYDEVSNPSDTVNTALETAKENKKHIIMQLGANWCGDAKRLDSFYEAHPEIKKTLKEDFIFVRVNVFSDGQFSEFYQRLPEFSWVPTLMIINSDGYVLEVIDARELETDGLYNEEIIQTTLEPFKIPNLE